MIVVQHRVVDEDKDDTSHEGLTHLQKSWSRGHVTGDLAWTSLADADLADVGYSSQEGENGGDDAIVTGLTGAQVSLQEVKREDDQSEEAEQGGIAGKCDWEVLPGDGGSGLKAKQLHQEDEQSSCEAEGPAEEAEVAGATVESAAVHSHREGYAGEDQSCQPGPEQRSGL